MCAAFDKVVKPQLRAVPALFWVKEENIVSLVHHDHMLLIPARNGAQRHEMGQSFSSVRLPAAIIGFTGKQSVRVDTRGQEPGKFCFACARRPIEKN